MLTQERAIICEPEFPNYEAGWHGGGARPLSWVAPWWQPVALSFVSALVVLSPPVGAWVSSAASGTEGSRVGSPTPQRTHLSGAACHVMVANDATCETFANETFRPQAPLAPLPLNHDWSEEKRMRGESKSKSDQLVVW